jgi:hypothetical protein
MNVEQQQNSDVAPTSHVRVAVSSCTLLTQIPQDILQHVIGRMVGKSTDDMVQDAVEEMRFLYGSDMAFPGSSSSIPELWTNRYDLCKQYIDERTVGKHLSSTELMWITLYQHRTRIPTYIYLTPSYDSSDPNHMSTDDQLIREWKAYREFYQTNLPVTMRDLLEKPDWLVHLRWIDKNNAVFQSERATSTRVMRVLPESLIYARLCRPLQLHNVPVSFAVYSRMMVLLGNQDHPRWGETWDHNSTYFSTIRWNQLFQGDGMFLENYL